MTTKKRRDWKQLYIPVHSFIGSMSFEHVDQTAYVPCRFYKEKWCYLVMTFSRKVVVYLWVVFVALQVLSVDEALNPLLQVSRFYWKLELYHQQKTGEPNQIFILPPSHKNMCIFHLWKVIPIYYPCTSAYLQLIPPLNTANNVWVSLSTNTTLTTLLFSLTLPILS